ncbi:MAG: hypothetical protein H6873_13330 [Hyphomicrobiaceae bacterium]|nr:hypothetical protein [Hyphomicrobiaceae bacterium]
MSIATDGKTSLRVWAAALWLAAMSAGWIMPDALAGASDDLGSDNHFAVANGPDSSGGPDPVLSAGEPSLPDVFAVLATAMALLVMTGLLPGPANGHAMRLHARLLHHFTDGRAPPPAKAASARRQSAVV